MGIDFDNLEKPIFVQLASILEDNILKGIFLQGEQIPSVAEISMYYKINPATANKGVNILADEGLVYKKRGIGMFVADNAMEILRSKRLQEFKVKFIEPMMKEAEKLGINRKEIVSMVGFEEIKED